MYVSSVRAIVTYMTMLPVADARAQLSRLIDEVTTTHERFEITGSSDRAGGPVPALSGSRHAGT